VNDFRASIQSMVPMTKMASRGRGETAKRPLSDAQLTHKGERRGVSATWASCQMRRHATGERFPGRIGATDAGSPRRADAATLAFSEECRFLPVGISFTALPFRAEDKFKAFRNRIGFAQNSPTA
jgi:hypothetical protein